ncbi:Uncharacterized protein conserved in cyanobacteria [Moraxella lacunata]|uniref:Uncharacterized protein conserved in cyanobacteria n=1 Tax=Moraxella lacunata TaxID=477 RepID=A0A378T6I5_MORLA|nr:Uma2 family endonuclease [Moraxella lacunata]STZ56442.1 Uncharacterized protein conserved in cyanobacteria [Moraxella lacunata]
MSKNLTLDDLNTVHPSMERIFRATNKNPTQLAKVINQSPQTINNWINRGISKQGAILVADKFNLSLDWILTGQEEKGVIFTFDKHNYLVDEFNKGESKCHCGINFNIMATMTVKLKDKPCKAYANNLKVKTQNNYFYPDVVVDCGDDEYIADKPILIIEILSKSTTFLDKTKKLWEYAQLATVQEYATVEQSFKQITLYRRENDWQAEIFETGEIYFKSIDLIVNIDEIYQGILVN